MEVMDHDEVTADEAAGSTRFSLGQIKKGSFARPFWAHVYGAPANSGAIGHQAQAAKDMNKYPELGRHL